jgi:hypothetical protein
MKLRISRQSVYLLSLSLLLLLISLLFAFLVLIPAGKEYRLKKMEREKYAQTLTQYQMWYDETFSMLKELQSKNKRVITAFDNRFDADRFVKTNRHYFQSLQLSQIQEGTSEAPFALYEVNATSRIGSPENFYDFLEGINKSDWIIGVNFPVQFKRDQDLILSSFTMQVHSVTAKE